jgi:hypothetical protein
MYIYIYYSQYSWGFESNKQTWGANNLVTTIRLHGMMREYPQNSYGLKNGAVPFQDPEIPI